MPAFDGDAVLHMLSVHEERIQRLETVTSELVGSVGELNATMTGFSKEMGLVSKNVCDKLDDVSSRLSEKIGDVVDINKEIVHDTKRMEKRVYALESEEKHDAKVAAWKAKVIWFFVASAAGAAITALVERTLGHH